MGPENTVNTINDGQLQLNEWREHLVTKIIVSHKNSDNVDCKLWLRSLDEVKNSRIKLINKEEPEFFWVGEISEDADESSEGFIIFNVKYMHYRQRKPRIKDEFASCRISCQKLNKN